MATVKRKKKARKKVIRVKTKSGPGPFGENEVEGKMFMPLETEAQQTLAEAPDRDESAMNKAIRVKRRMGLEGSGTNKTKAGSVKKKMGSEGPRTQMMRAGEEYRPVTKEGKKIKKKVKRKKK